MDDKDKDLSQPIDEQVPDEQKQEPSPSDEPVEDDAPAPEPDAPADEPDVAEDEPEEKPKSHRENLRIQQLVEKLRAQKAETDTQKPTGLDYKTALDADDEVIKRLEADRQEAAEASYNRGIARAESIQFHTRLELDAPRVAGKYPQFDKDSPDFNPVAASAINEWYLATVGYDQKTDTVKNANVRYADFVEGIMELADEMAGQKVAESKKNIASQAASTGLRPDGSSAKRLNLNKAPEDMTDEELDAMLAPLSKR